MSEREQDMGTQREHRPQRAHRSIRSATAVLVALVFVAPFVVMVSGSLRPAGLPPARSVELFSLAPAFANYLRIDDLVGLPRAIVNSLLIAVVAVPLSVLVASWAGFAVARSSPRARRLLIGVCVVALMVPATSLLVGRFALLRTLGTLDTPLALIAPALLGMSPLYVLVFAWAYSRVPRELFDVARLEGMSPATSWRRVGMPLVRPVTVAVAVLTFAVSWGGLLEPLILLANPRWTTVPLALRQLARADPPNTPLVLAAATVACLPPIVAFAAAQRSIASVVRGDPIPNGGTSTRSMPA